ncbi:hypothetical protein CAOG_08866 [Capsaspora owczarzaki ATCC 30864]|uniref:hypothetical protein n=1 Tax=Capsaspora owczarzaki (strain ATCC 30864) TaxID=595528 RepID=UPI0003525DF9|nr:hypothetical protein CAOG_08866 [Capsaspora owczarzaki ATCC 30864]|eukprot:XP_011270521.1 hypothetical protein CAOG_08866 [Capsaspora owczarzaki ATCC 30864]
MGGVFGKASSASTSSNGAKQQSRITPHDRAVLDLKKQRDNLKIYIHKIEAVLKREHELARTAVREGNKKKALLLLKRKRFQETLIERAEGQIQNVEELTASIEFAVVEQQVLAGIKAGTETLTELNNQMKLEDVERLMDDTQEAIAYQNEISEMLGTSLSEVDEAAVLAELEELEVASSAIQTAPDVPTHALPADSAASDAVQEAEEAGQPAESAKAKGKKPATQAQLAM